MIVILSLAGIVLLVVGYFCLFSSTPDQDKIARGAIMIGDTPVKIPLIGKTDDDLCTPTAAGVGLGAAVTAGVAAIAYACHDPKGFRSKFGDTVGDAAGAQEVDNTYLYASVGAGALALGGLGLYYFQDKIPEWLKFWKKLPKWLMFWKKSETQLAEPEKDDSDAKNKSLLARSEGVNPPDGGGNAGADGAQSRQQQGGDLPPPSGGQTSTQEDAAAAADKGVAAAESSSEIPKLTDPAQQALDTVIMGSSDFLKMMGGGSESASQVVDTAKVAINKALETEGCKELENGILNTIVVAALRASGNVDSKFSYVGKPVST